MSLFLITAVVLWFTLGGYSHSSKQYTGYYKSYVDKKWLKAHVTMSVDSQNKSIIDV